MLGRLHSSGSGYQPYFIAGGNNGSEQPGQVHAGGPKEEETKLPPPCSERVSNRHPSYSLTHTCVLYTNLKGGLLGVILPRSPGECILGPVFHLPWCFAKNPGTFGGHLAVAGLMTRARKPCRKDVSAISACTFRQATLSLCVFMMCTRQGPAHRPTLQFQR